MKNLMELKAELSRRFATQAISPEILRNHIRARITGEVKAWRLDAAPGALRGMFVRNMREIGRELSQAGEHDWDEALDFFNRNRGFERYTDTRFTAIFEKRFGDHFVKCQDCGDLEITDESLWAYDDYPVCRNCRENYRWSERQERYISCDDWHDEDDEDSVIGDYHSTDVGHIPSDYDNRKMRVLLGMELEVEVREGDRDQKAESLIHNIGTYRSEAGEYHQYCGVEHDGSLDHGFEIVTGYTGLDVHKHQLEFFKKPWNGVKSHDTRTCGLHVHVCKRGVTMLHAAKMIFFINESSNMRLIRAIARRDSSSYASIKNKKADYEWLKRAKQCRDPLSNLNEDRYEALNFKNPGTIEFRLFRGTLKYETIMACLEFTFATWHFTRNAGMHELNIDGFLKFICAPENRRDTSFLREYLASKNFDLPKPKHLKLVGREGEMEFENRTAQAA